MAALLILDDSKPLAFRAGASLASLEIAKTRIDAACRQQRALQFRTEGYGDAAGPNHLRSSWNWF
ncbi:hypothetical protein CK219_19010 [Mesorhizobium sp. WSM4313]|nr:hypothetical protein CK219_19010 [Mesorhizobium sp. WSM4313]